MPKRPPAERRPRVHLTMRQFEQAVEEALAAIPKPFQDRLDEIEFVAARSSGQGLLGLYQGSGALAAGDWPARITVYRDAHEARCASHEELVAELRRTLLHEIGHHFHMEEGELPY